MELKEGDYVRIEPLSDEQKQSYHYKNYKYYTMYGWII